MKSIVLILILFSVPVNAAPLNRLTWERVEGASGYYLEIKNSADTVVVAETVSVNYYDISKLDPGKYTFRIATVNILNQRGESTDWIEVTVEKLFVPELKSVSRSELVASMANRNIIIRGVNFKSSSRFLLRGEGREIELADFDVRSEKEVVITFKPETSDKGRYDLVIINRGDVESVLKDAIVIVEPEKAETVYYLGGFYSVNMPMGAFPQYFATSFTGAGLFLQVPALNFGYDNILLEAEVDAARYVNTADSRKCSLTYVTLGLGLDYVYPVSFAPVELIFKFLAGPAYTVLTLDENPTGKEQTSIDWFAMAGAGVRYYMTGSAFIEPAFAWKTVFYTGTFFHDSRIYINCGVRF